MGLSLGTVRRFAAAPPSKKLTLAGGAVGIFLLTLLVSNLFLPKEKAVTREMLGHDFLAFYTAGTFVNGGRSHELYRLESVRQFQQTLAEQNQLDIGSNFAPWWNPPFYALAFKSLARLPYPAALSAWRWINFAAFAVAAALLAWMIILSAPSRRRIAGLVPLLIVVSMPFIQATGHAQNTMISLLLLTATCFCWRAKRGFLAGLVGGLLFYKPQLGAVVAGVMLLDLGTSALIGLGITGGLLLTINLVALPGTLGDWLHQVPSNVHWIQAEHSYLWERHVTLKAFWRLLLQGRTAGEASGLTMTLTDLCVAVFGFRLLHAAGRGHLDRSVAAADSIHRDSLIVATVTVMPLLMPFYFDYDLMLLAVAATLFAIDRLRSPESPDRKLTAAWIAFGAWLYVNPPLAMRTHVNVTVLLLSGVGWMSLNRVGRSREKSEKNFETFCSQASVRVAA